MGSAAYGLAMAFGPVVSPVINRYGAHVAVIIGSVLCACSLLISSFAANLETLFGTFSLLYGVGTSLAYTPTMTIASDYFVKYVALATGIMCAGSSTGTLILSPVTQALISVFGWRNAMRVLSGMSIYAVKVHHVVIRTIPFRTTEGGGLEVFSQPPPSDI